MGGKLENVRQKLFDIQQQMLANINGNVNKSGEMSDEDILHNCDEALDNLNDYEEQKQFEDNFIINDENMFQMIVDDLEDGLEIFTEEAKEIAEANAHKLVDGMWECYSKNIELLIEKEQK